MRGDLISVEDAVHLVCQDAISLGTLDVDLDSAFGAAGMVLARDIHADRDYPPFNKAMMDGFALRAEDYADGTRDFTVTRSIAAGQPGGTLDPKPACVRIMTGAPLPNGADCVIPIEQAIESPQTGRVRFELTPEQVPAWRSVARQASELRRGDLALAAGETLQPPALTTLASLGAVRFPVWELPRPTIISTGSELAAPEAANLPGHVIRDSNSAVLAGLFRARGIAPRGRQRVPDDPALLRQVLGAALEEGCVVLTGGVSMGDHDHIPTILTELGVERRFHGVAIKPGKPFWFGRKDDSVVFALPGNPMAGLVAFKVFVEPWLAACLELSLKRQGGQRELTPRPSTPELFLPMAQARAKRDRRSHYFPVAIKPPGAGGLSTLREVSSSGSGDIRSGKAGDGLACHPADLPTLEAGQPVRFLPW